MKTTVRRLFALSALLIISRLGAAELPHARPEEVGISPAKLREAQQAVQQLVDSGQFAGALTVVARNGKIVEMQTFGMKDLEQHKPMTADTIFRIYSMTKPITTVAAMMLVEEGKLSLDAPVSQYIPEMKGLRVYKGPGDETVPAQREITIRDLMRHTAGFTYGAFGDSPVDRMYKEKKLLDRNVSLEEFVSKLSKIPLQYQPGTKFHYSVAVDVLGRVVEVVSGKTLDVVFEERIFKPLEMVDTAFYVPSDKADRFATNYGPGPNGKLRVIDDPAKSAYLKPPKFFSGGGGLVSTARDYSRFCQMMLNGGELGGARLLKPATVEVMTHNQLPTEALPLTMPSGNSSDKGLGFGLGFGVRIAPNPADPTAVVGEYYWGGAASTGFTICPKNQTFVIAMTQYMPFSPKLAEVFKRGVNLAIESNGAKQAAK